MRTLISCIKAFFRSHSVKLPIIIVIIVAVVLFSLGGVLVYKVAINPIVLFQTPVPTNTEAPTPVPSSKVVLSELTDKPTDEIPTFTPEPEKDSISKNTGIINILLVGADFSPEREDWDKNYYSDVMMVIAIDFDNNKVDMISVPRDTFAPIYNTPGIYKLNSALHHGGGVDAEGFDYVARSIENILGGVSIDYYMGVNMEAIKILVDAIGGVYYDVDVTFTMNGRLMEMGYQHLNGQQVLDYCRVRKGIDNDIGRVGRQKKVMIAVFEKLKKSSLIFDVPDILNSLKDDVHTNMSFEQFCALAIFGKNLDSDDIETHTVVGHFLQIFNYSIYILKDELRIELIEEIYGFTAEPMLEASQKYANLTWATIQAETYIQIVLDTIERDGGKTISSTNRRWLQKEMDVLQKAIDAGDRYIIEEKAEALKEQAKIYFGSVGFKVSWYVSENPGQEAMTG